MRVWVQKVPYRLRARSIGLRQVTIARLLGRTEGWVSRAMHHRFGGAPSMIVAIVTAWEIMTPAQRVDWMLACGVMQTRTRQPVYGRREIPAAAVPIAAAVAAIVAIELATSL